jgi:hypothetical protein
MGTRTARLIKSGWFSPRFSAGRDVAGYLDEFGKRRERTRELRVTVLELESRLRPEASDYLDALGMTSKSRAKLGLDLQRTVDLATAMSEPDPSGARSSCARRAVLSAPFSARNLAGQSTEAGRSPA